MPRWNEGSITDIAARPRFHREATPVWLVTACALLGHRAPDPAKSFRYADLGCGTGLTALTVAATCPHAEIWGFDFNPANIEAARDLAARAGLTNIRFMETSFADMAAMAADTLPPFDFMVAEAVLGVLSPENQRHIHTLIGRHLRPGGLAYLGYAADTGWTEFVPLQTLMRMTYEAGAEVSDLAVPGIFEQFDQLRTGGAHYFQRNPILEHRIAELRQRPPADVAHEFLNQEWHALMFADVADAMAEVKCDFLGRATLHENIAAASAPSAMLPLLEDAATLRIRETMQDIAAVTPYRRDIYRRGVSFMPVAEHHAALAAITVVEIDQRAQLLPTWRGAVPADPELYQPLIEALRQGPLTVAHAATLGPLAECPLEEAADAVAMLIAAGKAHPLAYSLAHPLAPSAAAARPTAARLNGAIIDAITRGEEMDMLVSPLLGAALPVTATEALLIGALSHGRPPEDLEGLTGDVLLAMRRGGRALTRDGLPIADAEEETALLRETLATLLAQRVPLFRALGVLAA